LSFVEDREDAIEAASDAIARRARVLEGTEPGVAELMREFAARLDEIKVRASDRTKRTVDAIATENLKKAREAWL